MCNCPYHFDVTAECNCQCDHEIEYVIETLVEKAYLFLCTLDPEVVKALAKHINKMNFEEVDNPGDID